MTCRICEQPLQPFISFGQQPIANGFLTPADFSDEYFYELAVAFCDNCHMVQLMEQPERERMFHDQYAFFSSTSQRMADHFATVAQLLHNRVKDSPHPFVVELGSNDGIMLRHLAAAGISHLGTEPSANVAAVAQAQGIATITKFFDEALARDIVAEHGQADAVFAANTMCHIPYLHSVAAGMKQLLAPHGVLMFEDPYLGDILEKTSYDQIYDEHVFFFSLDSVSNLFARHGLQLIDAAPQNVHGGSMRYTIAHQGAFAPSAAVTEQLAKEQALGIPQRATYEGLRQRIETSRDQLKSLLERLHQENRRVVGYGATSKSTTVINYCGFTPDLIEFISDTTPIKQGKFSPGAHIPVRPYEEFLADYPDYALLFAWNHAAEIMAHERDFERAGGQWITFVPSVAMTAHAAVR